MWCEPTDIIELQDCLDKFVDWYNNVREHSALDYDLPEVRHYAKT